MGGMWRESSLAAGESIGTILASRPLIEHTVFAAERWRSSSYRCAAVREWPASSAGRRMTGVRLSTGEEITSELTVDASGLSVVDASKVR